MGHFLRLRALAGFLGACTAILALGASPVWGLNQPKGHIPVFHGRQYVIAAESQYDIPPYSLAYNGNPCAIGLTCDSSGNLLVTGGIGGVPVTNAGISAITAGAVQGVTGGVPIAVTGIVGAAAPLSGTTDTQGTGPNQAMGCAIYNATGGGWDRCREGLQLGSVLVSSAALTEDGCSTGCVNFINVAATPYVIKESTGVLYGIDNLEASNQTATVTVYDNASACSGKVLGKQLLASGQSWSPSQNGGVTALLGITVCTSGAAVGNGYGILFQ